MTGRVDEGDDAPVDLDLRGADGLGDATGLPCGDARVADGVEKRRLAVVDMAHDRDDGGTGHQVLGVVEEGEGVLLLLGHDLDVPAEVIGDQLDELVGHGLGQGQGRAQQEQALDDVVGGDAEEPGQLRDRGALWDPDGVELRDVLVVGDGLLDALLLGGLLGLLLPALLALLATTGGLAGGLLDGHTGLLEDVGAVVLLRLAGHAAVAVLLLASPASGLASPAPALAALVSGRGGAGTLGGAGRGAATGTVLVVTFAATGLVLLLGGLLRLLLQDLLLLGDLVEQAGEGRDRLGGGVLHAIALGLLGGKALRLQALLLGPLARGLGGGALALLLGSLALATGLRLDALPLGLLRLDALPLGLGLGLGPLGGLDLRRTGLEDGLELLAHDGDVGILQSRGRGLGRDLHVCEMAEHLLAGHAIFLGEVMYARLCHVTNLSGTRVLGTTRWDPRARSGSRGRR